MTVVRRLLSALLFVVAPFADAAEPRPDFLAQFPSPARAIAEIDGDDPLDTLALRVAALKQLSRAVEEMADRRRWNDLTPPERALIDRYGAEAARLQAEAERLAGPGDGSMDSPRAKWFFAEGRYERDIDRRDALLKRHFTPEFIAEHRRLTQASDARAAEGAEALRIGLAGDRLGRWGRMSRDDRETAAAFAVVLGLLSGLLLLRELLPFGVTAGRPPRLRAGWRSMKLVPHTGRLHDYRAWDEVTHTVTERLNNLGQVLSREYHSSSVHHEAFTFVTATEKHEVHVLHTHFGAAEGDEVTMVQAKRLLRRRPQWILMRNLTQGARQVPIVTVVHDLLRMSRWWHLIGFVGGYFLGATTDLISWIAPRGNSLLLGFLGAFIGSVAIFIVRAIVAMIRERRFVRRGTTRLGDWLATNPVGG